MSGRQSGLPMAGAAWFMVSAIVSTSVVTDVAVCQKGRPDFYPKSAPQFTFYPGHDPRMVILARAGQGVNRRAEVAILEVVDRGGLLRPLHRVNLRNSYMPLRLIVAGGGRFLVTMDEWEGAGTTDNCLVLYDLVRGEDRAMKLTDFLAEDIRGRLRHHEFVPGVSWTAPSPSWYDPRNEVLYPNKPEDCHEFGVPFMSIDLRSRSVAVEKVPARLGAGVVEEPRVAGVGWEWSMGNAVEPAWDAKGMIPTYLKGVVDDALVSSEQRRMLGNKGELCFRWDAARSEYVACDPKEWVARERER